MFSRVGRMFGDKSLTMVGIDGKTALVMNNDGRYEVVGHKTVTIFSTAGKKSYHAGMLQDGALA